MKRLTKEFNNAMQEAREKMEDASSNIDKILNWNGEYKTSIDKAGHAFEHLTAVICEKKRIRQSHPVME